MTKYEREITLQESIIQQEAGVGKPQNLITLVPLLLQSRSTSMCQFQFYQKMKPD